MPRPAPAARRTPPTRLTPALALLALATLITSPASLHAQEPTPASVMAEAPNAAWRDLAPENTVYMELETGAVVVIELSPDFSPAHVENIRRAVRLGVFDGGGVTRSQDNYVAQWSIDLEMGRDDMPPEVATALPAEFTTDAHVLPFTPVPDGDIYAPEAGFVRGFPAGRDPDTGRAWMLHCYGSVGVARGEDPNSGSGLALYAVNGHAPRHLDRILSMAGRVISGMEHLATLPRGTDRLGFYATDEEVTRFTRVRMGTELPEAERLGVQIMRTDSPSFQDWMVARRNRRGAFWIDPADRIEVCNVTVPTRERPGS